MKPYDENKKSKRKKTQKDKTKFFFDEDRFYEQKLNKEFKYRKKYISDEDEDEDWKNWDRNVNH